jgi:hypothetical protein
MNSWSLTPEQQCAYRSDGYVVPAVRISQQRVDTLNRALEAVVAACPDVRPEQLTGAHIATALSGTLDGPTPFLSLALDPDLLTLVSGVLGDDIVMWGIQLFCKPGDDGMEVPMHQDGQYWPIRPLATCTVWLALDDSDRHNGCLAVIRGSHRERIHYAHRTRDESNLVLNQAVDDARVPSGTEYVELESGQLSMHDVYLVHGSSPNTSGRRRAGLAIRYMPATSWFRRDVEMPFTGYAVQWDTKPIWLARGHDICGKNDFQVGHSR